MSKQAPIAKDPSKRFALIIANYQYEDPDLRQLIAPAQDANSLKKVLSDPEIGGFIVERFLINEPSHKVNLAIEAFFDNRQRDDLLLLYFSGHGIKDKENRLYFATPDTRRSWPRTTAIPAALINDVMRSSRSRRQALILDCCYSGAFAKGMIAKAEEVIGSAVGSGEQLGGRGRVVMTASDAIQYAFEGNTVEGKGVHSVFTKNLVRGLESGEADLDGDGQITFDELYEYVYDRVTDEMSQQRPEKWDFGVQGNIIIARNPNPVARLVELPAELQESTNDLRPWVREGAVRELNRLLQSDQRGLAKASHDALKRLTKDDSRRVSEAATKSLEAYYKLKRSKIEDLEGLEVSGSRSTQDDKPDKLNLEAFKSKLKNLPSKLWIYGRFAVLILILGGFFGPWAAITACSSTTIHYGYEPVVILFAIPVVALFAFTLLNLLLARWWKGITLVWLERIASAFSVINSGINIAFLNTNLLWGFWVTFGGVILASINLVSEYVLKTYPGGKPTRRGRVLIVLIIIAFIVFLHPFVTQYIISPFLGVWGSNPP